jgi:hypothetical protein
MPLSLTIQGPMPVFNDLTFVILLLSLVGALGLSILWPITALAVSFLRRIGSPRTESPVLLNPSRIDIRIPAHNESQILGLTLMSLRQSIEFLKLHGMEETLPDIRIHVGADACTDTTIQEALRIPGVHVTEYPYHSKWQTLKALCQDSSADWIVLVDAGTVWPDRLLADLLYAMNQHPEAIALCPAYKPLHSSWIHRALWRLEASLKRIEVLSGGPVSVHGATVCYKAAPLKNAMENLGSTDWLNDDVAIPLTLRALYPKNLILYPVGMVFDEGVRQDKRALKRRARILLGNLQWARSLLPVCFRQNPIAGTLALRRLFRVLWAYWVVFALLSIGLISGHLLPLCALMGLSIATFKSGRELAGAALISLWTPFRLFAPPRSLLGVWK